MIYTKTHMMQGFRCRDECTHKHHKSRLDVYRPHAKKCPFGGDISGL